MVRVELDMVGNIADLSVENKCVFRDIPLCSAREVWGRVVPGLSLCE
jgi:hypothetical protein